MPHIPFTWGSGWAKTISESSPEIQEKASQITHVIASDILLYVSAYSALVDSLTEIFKNPNIRQFIMSWNRRIAESAIFFDLMKAKKGKGAGAEAEAGEGRAEGGRRGGFKCQHMGKCIFVFERDEE